jgi:hypothetical protein
MHESTHAIEGVTCLDCHKFTELNTGHTFTIQADSCTNCHDETLHAANKLALSVPVQPDQDPTEESETPSESHATDEQLKGANVIIPTWGYLLFGMLVGVAGFWVVKGKEPGISSESMTEESDGEQDA